MDEMDRGSQYLARASAEIDAVVYGVANHGSGVPLADGRDKLHELRRSGAADSTSTVSAAVQFVLDQLPVGVAVTDSALNVVVTNVALDSRVQAEDGVTLRERFFALTDAEAQQQLVMRIAELGAMGAVPATFALRARRGLSQPDLHVAVSSVRDRQWCIWVFDPQGPRELSASLLRDLHGFTDAEAKVASALFMGRSTKEAAAALEISVNTVKAHLKGIFRKCGVRSQAELSQLLALSVARVG